MAGKMALRKLICFACSQQFPEVPCEPIECPIIQVIKDIDTESLRPKGQWITDDKGVTYCGRCRHIDDYASVHNYCPICGAKMEV